jgi:protein TonB
MQGSRIPMPTSEISNLGPVPSPSPAPSDAPGPSGAWLGSQSVFDKKEDRKLGRALSVSIALHAVPIALLLLFGVPKVVIETVKQMPMKFDIVFTKTPPGPGGGGGGSPQPAPAKKLEIPKPKAVEPLPTPTPPPPVEPPPTLNAPVQTNLAQTLQASGSSSVSLAPLGGGGSGGGIGSGRGNGLGEGTGGGTGGGVYAPGNGVSMPALLSQVDPQYTSEAMRAKVQGVVTLDAVVQPNGRLSDIKVRKSLDRTYGLDLAAMEAAKKWLFSPCKKDGKPVPCTVQLELEFRLH